MEFHVGSMGVGDGLGGNGTLLVAKAFVVGSMCHRCRRCVEAPLSSPTRAPLTGSRLSLIQSDLFQALRALS